jgi:hypothetical protein
MTLSLPAQELDRLVQESEALFEKTSSKLLFPVQSHFDSEQHFYTKLDTSRSVNFLTSELKKWQSQQSLQDIGLVFKASARYNFTNVFDNENNNFNIGQVRAELEWNVLKSGYTNNRAQSKRFENEMQLLRNNQLAADRVLMRRQFRIDYTYAINQEALQLFENFFQFENEYFDFLNKLYFKKYIKRERLIEVSQQINVLKNQMQVLEKETQMIQDSVSNPYKNQKSLPFLQLNIDSLSYANATEDVSLQKENVYLQHKPINDLNLSFYVQETFNYSNAGHRFFPSMGVRFKAPIRFNRRKKIIETKLKILEAQHTDQSVGKYNRIITLINGYNEKLKDVQNQYKSWKVLEERIRVLTILKQELNQQEAGMLLLELLQEKFRVLENMIQLKRQLYTALSHIFEVLESPNIESIVSPIDFTQYNQNTRFALKSDEQFDLNFQIQFLKAKGCVEVEVLESDIATQKALLQGGMRFYTVAKLSNQKVADAMQKEMNQIQRKP